jgi:hypothetical protein
MGTLSAAYILPKNNQQARRHDIQPNDVQQNDTLKEGLFATLSLSNTQHK